MRSAIPVLLFGSVLALGLMGSNVLFSLVNIPWRYGAALFIQMALAVFLSYALAASSKAKLKQEIRRYREKDLAPVVPWGTGRKLALLSLVSLGVALPFIGPNQILDPFRLLFFSALASSPLVLVFHFAETLRESNPRYALPNLAFFALMASMFTFGAVNFINARTDDSVASTHEVEIQRLASQPRSRIVKTSGKEMTDLYVALSSSHYEGAQIGDALELKIRKGRLGIPWIESYRFLRTSDATEKSDDD